MINVCCHIECHIPSSSFPLSELKLHSFACDYYVQIVRKNFYFDFQNDFTQNIHAYYWIYNIGPEYPTKCQKNDPFSSEFYHNRIEEVRKDSNNKGRQVL